MGLYEKWRDMCEAVTTPEEHTAYWDEYFAAETLNYKKILSDKDKVFSGTLEELAKEFSMEPVVFSGFMDGINDSLVTPYDVQKLKEETPISLHVDFKKLYFNMLAAKAKWLYTLSEWEEVLTEEERHEITKEWRASRQAVNENKVGRNDPCPCGSGKKYKKCCGKGLV